MYFGFRRPNSWEVLGSVGCGFGSRRSQTRAESSTTGSGSAWTRHQIGVHVDGAADVVREDVAKGVVQGILDLGLQDFAGEFVGDGHQQGGTDQALCLGEDDEAALTG